MGGHGDGRRDAVDPLRGRLFQALEELPRIGRKALDVPALPFSVQRVERQAALARSADAAEHNQAPLRQVEIDTLEVVYFHPAERDHAVSHVLFPLSAAVRNDANCYDTHSEGGESTEGRLQNRKQMAPQRSARRRWYQFGLGTMLLLIAILSLACAWARREMSASGAEQRALAEFDAARVAVRVRTRTPAWANAILPSSAARRFRRVVSLIVQHDRLDHERGSWLFSRQFADVECAKLAAFGHLEELGMCNTAVTPIGLETIYQLQYLKKLDVRSERVVMLDHDRLPNCHVLSDPEVRLQ